ncbi:ornithine cyclodeaminase family protein [Pseudogemmobacter humi]|uniref:ornithine cyclodeaminase family protein n=1 Tax=Pseudogemmobacter humi TaxID=2483812 RepID=UPI001F3BA67C|nr:ornithine cyclodeaminase [Pseudogemmobacter humi]
MTKTAQIGPEDLAGKVSWTAIADAIEAGHRLPRARLGDQFLTRGPDTLLSRAAWIDGLGFGVKSMSRIAANRALGKPSVQGAMTVFDDLTGRPLAFVDGPLVTYWKTAGDSVLGARILARPDSRRLLILGAGVVAESLAHAYRDIFPALADIAIWNRSPAAAAELAARLAGQHIPARPAPDLAAAVAQADIIASATATVEPVLRGDWLRPGTHVDLIGAFTAEMREADDTLLQKARLFVDCRETVLHDIGELKIPLASGAIRESDVLGDLYDLTAGMPGRTGPRDITVFKNGGGAHLDLMTAHHLIRAAGLPVSLSDPEDRK